MMSGMMMVMNIMMITMKIMMMMGMKAIEYNDYITAQWFTQYER